jgi:hypothetical protein
MLGTFQSQTTLSWQPSLPLTSWSVEVLFLTVELTAVKWQSARKLEALPSFD